MSQTEIEGAEAPFLGNAQYLSMNLPFEPFARIKTEIEQVATLQLKDRGEAHITVITPPEYTQYFKKNCTMKQLNTFAQSNENPIQSAKLNYLGLGSASAEVSGRSATVFFVVIQSDDLVRIRENLKSRCKVSDQFDPRSFLPHVTVGYTDRDLHEADGVVKDSSSIDPRFNLSVQ